MHPILHEFQSDDKQLYHLNKIWRKYITYSIAVKEHKVYVKKIASSWNLTSLMIDKYALNLINIALTPILTSNCFYVIHSYAITIDVLEISKLQTFCNKMQTGRLYIYMMNLKYWYDQHWTANNRPISTSMLNDGDNHIHVKLSASNTNQCCLWLESVLWCYQVLDWGCILCEISKAYMMFSVCVR